MSKAGAVFANSYITPCCHWSIELKDKKVCHTSPLHKGDNFAETPFTAKSIEHFTRQAIGLFDFFLFSFFLLPAIINSIEVVSCHFKILYCFCKNIYPLDRFDKSN